MFLNDDQIANILTYVRNAWGNREDAITKESVADFRAKHSSRFLPWTEAELDALLK